MAPSQASAGDRDRKGKSPGLPPPHVVDVAPTSWVLPNRVGFPEWVAKTFRYDPASSDPRDLYIHQRFVRDYLQPASPYRGLLLFHGLGVGKTCAAIAIADVLCPPSAPRGKVFVMLPAFLRGNFVAEVQNCGDPRFSVNRAWKRLPAALTKQGKARKTPPASVFQAMDIDQGGVPYHLLKQADREAVVAQIQRDITDHYTIIHYNGLSASSVAKLCDGTLNIFDDSVVIIDEAPNVIGQVMHKKLMENVYQRILDADRCKVVLLSGTPLVNDPRELAYIANLVHGYIKEVSISSIPESVDIQAVELALSSHPLVDHVSSEVLFDGSKITATLLPRGFRKTEDGTNQVAAMPDAPTQSALVTLLRGVATAAAGVPLREPEVVDRFLLPIDEGFKAAFVAPSTSLTQSEPTEVLNAEVLVRRLMGTVSVYANSDPALMPTILPARVVRLPMSDRQFEEYLLQREIEHQKERTAARFAARAASAGASADSTSLYRAFSRSVCTFVFPKGINRPYRSDLYKTAKAGQEEEEGEGEGEGEGGQEEEEEEEGTDTGRGDGTDDTEGYDRPVDTRLAKQNIDRVYDDNLKAALALIYAERSRLLTITGELPMLSPKYAALISHLLEPKSARRPAIIYSQFRRVEGLGLLGMALVSNGFVELRVSTKAGVLVVEAFPPEAPPLAPRFIVYGNDDGPAATAMLQIFNSQVSKLPATVTAALSGILAKAGQPGLLDGQEGNRHGALARLLLITQSGSEGISTRNVREVHIVEPFWHANRILQVVGRAARSNSHSDLPQDERTVEVSVYAATLTPLQASNVTITKLDKKLTSDEHILGVATRKRALLDKFTDVMRRTAVDCALHHPKSAPRRCFAHPAAILKRGAAALAFHTDLSVDIASQARRIRLLPFLTDHGRQGLADPATGTVFDRVIHAETGRLQTIGTRRPSSITRQQPEPRSESKKSLPPPKNAGSKINAHTSTSTSTSTGTPAKKG